MSVQRLKKPRAGHFNITSLSMKQNRHLNRVTSSLSNKDDFRNISSLGSY